MSISVLSRNDIALLWQIADAAALNRDEKVTILAEELRALLSELEDRSAEEIEDLRFQLKDAEEEIRRLEEEVESLWRTIEGDDEPTQPNGHPLDGAKVWKV